MYNIIDKGNHLYLKQIINPTHDLIMYAINKNPLNFYSVKENDMTYENAFLAVTKSLHLIKRVRTDLLTDKFINDVVNNNNDIIKYLPIKYITNIKCNKYESYINKCINSNDNLYLYSNLFGNNLINKLYNIGIKDIDVLFYLFDNNYLKNHFNVCSEDYRLLYYKIKLLKYKPSINTNSNIKNILYELGINKNIIKNIDTNIKYTDLIDKYYLINNKEVFETFKILNRYYKKDSLETLKKKLELFKINQELINNNINYIINDINEVSNNHVKTLNK